MHTTCVLGASRDRKTMLSPPELELLTTVNHYMGAGN